ncbi:MAG: peptidoglycan editing factor PgeF [Rugosibacter sp.]|nr:peptidoglycan editing factor PgeF [Rugosibacter sp.]
MGNSVENPMEKSGISNLLIPSWHAPSGVHALVTTREHGASMGPWASFNLASHVGDDAAAVAANRAQLRQNLPADPPWLTQVHGTRCVDAAQVQSGVEADASFTRQRGVVCAVLTADCLPVLLCDDNASVVSAVHAGWRGLADGVIEASVAAMQTPGEQLMAWLGPAIGPTAFEVGADVRDAFLAHDLQAAQAFTSIAKDKWLCDIYLLARQRLQALNIRRTRGVLASQRIASADFCTVRDIDRFYSFRRDGISGRMASCIWLE